MSDRNANRKPTPRRRTSTRGVERGRTGDQGTRQGRSRERSADARQAASRGRSPASRRSAPAPGGRRASVESNSARPVSAFDWKWLAIAGALLAIVAIVALVFAFGGQGGDKQESSGQSSEAAATTQSNKNSGPYSVNFTTTGDLIFWREVADFIDANGGAAAMAGIADLLSDADVTISNLESPLSDNDSEPVYDKDVYIIGRPSAMEGIVNSGIDIVSLANNHIMDYTGPALQDTLAALDAAGIQHAGAGMTEAEADKIVETEVNGVKIAFFSWTDIVPDNFVAFGDQPGVASARLNMNDALRRVREAKETHDVVIVAMHWGIEYQDYVDEAQQVTPAHQLVEAGADVVLGNHPHVLQGIEFYNGSLIAYAHGNCVFRQAFEFGNTHESYVLNFDITQDGVRNVVVTPLYLSDDYGIPSVATGEQAQTTLSRLVEISEGMNTAFDLRDNKAYISPAS